MKVVTAAVVCRKCKKETIGTWEPGTPRVCVGCGADLPLIPARKVREEEP